MDVLALIGGLLWLVAWAVAVSAAMRLTRLRRPEFTLWTLATRGILFFRRDTFKPGHEADRAYRVFLAAVLGAAVALALLIVASILVGAFDRPA